MSAPQAYALAAEILVDSALPPRMRAWLAAVVLGRITQGSDHRSTDR